MQSEEKKRFLSQKFKATQVNAGVHGGMWATAAVLAIPFDMGLSFGLLVGTGVFGSLAALQGIGYDSKRKAIKNYTNPAGQFLKAPEWAQEHHETLEKRLLSLNAKMAKAEKQCDNVKDKYWLTLETLRALEDHIDLVDKAGAKIDGDIHYIIDKNKPPRRINAKGEAVAPPQKKIEAFKL